MDSKASCKEKGAENSLDFGRSFSFNLNLVINFKKPLISLISENLN